MGLINEWFGPRTDSSTAPSWAVNSAFTSADIWGGVPPCAFYPFEKLHTSDDVVWDVNYVTLFGQVGGYGDTINTSYSPGLLWMIYRLACVKADIH